ncbi:PaaI family thioesterase [Gordonia sp. CPCC 206044]|uniref:PaaI family thioesterase n=1 Tax=Gordonia sp. CPCC 206044 TaxID=3140793 RepID=UPI003AF36196
MLDFEAGRTVLDAQPFSRMLGARLTRLDGDRATLTLDVRDDLRQQYGYIHGGVLSYLADNALTYAAALGLGPDIITSGFSIEYVAPAKDGRELQADAVLVHAGRTKAVARCEISMVSDDGTRRVVATALGTSMVRNRGTTTAVQH